MRTSQRPPLTLTPRTTDLDRVTLGASLLREGTRELERLRRVRGAHTRTARRIQRALAVVALAASLLGVPFAATPAAASTPIFSRSTNPFGPFGTTDVGQLSTPAFADLDGDGDLDALIGSGDGVHFLRNTGTPQAPIFVAAVVDPFGIANVGSFSAPAFADIDGDGDLDLLVGDASGNTAFFQNTGTPTAPAFTAPVANPFGLATVGSFSAPAFADLDGDDDLDALVGTFDGATVYFENAGTPTAPAFAAPVTNPFGLTTVGQRSRPTLANVDGDGDLDAFVGEYDGRTSSRGTRARRPLRRSPRPSRARSASPTSAIRARQSSPTSTATAASTCSSGPRTAPWRLS